MDISGPKKSDTALETARWAISLLFGPEISIPSSEKVHI
jgi:hypothetical protein